MIRPALIPMLEFEVGPAASESQQAKHYWLSLAPWDRSCLELRFQMRQFLGRLFQARVSWSRSSSPARERKISGEALTTAGSATLEFSVEIGEVNDEGVLAFSRQGEQEVRAI